MTREQMIDQAVRDARRRFAISPYDFRRAPTQKLFLPFDFYEMVRLRFATLAAEAKPRKPFRLWKAA